MKPNRIHKTNSDISDELKEVNRKGNVKSINQMDAETPGGFVESSKEEVQLEIDSKLQERIILQNKLRKQELTQTYCYTEIAELEKIFKDYDLKIKDELPEWYGIHMPKDVLAMEINCKIHDWKDMMSNRSYLIQGLENIGFKKKHIEDILVTGKILSDKKLMQKLEKDFETKKLKEKPKDE